MLDEADIAGAPTPRLLAERDGRRSGFVSSALNR